MPPHAAAELTFELPPKLSWPVERRLSGHAVTAWRAACRNGELPPAATFERGELALACADSSVSLIASANGVRVMHVGTSVATAFGLACGRLTTAEPPLGATLDRAFAEIREGCTPVSFEARLRGGDGASVLLTRGVLLPLLDANGALTQALAIITWKEALGATARDRLQDEIGGAIAAGRAGRHRRDRQLSDSLYAAFAPAPNRGVDRAVKTWPVRAIACIGGRHLVTAPLPTHKRGQQSTEN